MHTRSVVSRSHSETDAAWQKVFEEISARLQSDETVDADALVAEFPLYGERLCDLLPVMQAMAEMGRATGFSAGAESGDATSADGSLAGEDAKPGRTLGDFRLIRELGRGGMGVVYEAEQISLGRRVALKVLPFAAILDERQLVRFKNEARAAATLHHTNIVPVFSVGCERGVHFYAMQFIEGQTLAQVVIALRAQALMRGGLPTSSPAIESDRRSDGEPTAEFRSDSQDRPNHLESPPPDSDVETIRADGLTTILTEQRTSVAAHYRTIARLGIQAAEALEHAHQHGVIHRDIKPANLMLDAAGNLWIADFGLARLETDAGMTMTGDLVGTLRYMSPEQALGKRVVIDHRTDVYSLGVTLYELLAHEPPFDGADRAVLLRQVAFDEPKRLRSRQRDIPRELETIVLKAIEKKPDERYESAQALAEDLRRFVEDKPIHAKRPTAWERTKKWSRRHSGFVVTAALVLLVMTVTAIVGTALIANAYKRESDERTLAERAARNEHAARTVAERNLHRAEAAVNELIVTVAHEDLVSIPQLATVRKNLYRKAVQFYSDLLDDNNEDDEVKFKRLQAQHYLNTVRDYTADHTGDFDRSQQATALALDALVRKYPVRSDYAVLASQAYGDLAYRLFHTKRYDEAELYGMRAIEIIEPHATPTNRLASEQLASWLGAQSERCVNRGEFEKAEVTVRKAISVLEKLPSLPPAPTRPTHSPFTLALGYCNLAFTLQLRDFESAFKAMEHAYTLDPNELAISISYARYLLRANRPAQAEELSLQLIERLVPLAAHSNASKRQLADVCRNYSEMLIVSSRYDEALVHADKAQTLFVALQEGDVDDSFLRFRVAEMNRLLGTAAYELNRNEQAEYCFRLATEQFATLLDDQIDSSFAQIEVSLNYLVHLVKQDRCADGVKVLEQLERRLQEIRLQTRPAAKQLYFEGKVASLQTHIAQLYLELNNYKASQQALMHAADSYRKSQAEVRTKADRDFIIDVARKVICAHLSSGQLSDAEIFSDRAIAEYSSLPIGLYAAWEWAIGRPQKSSPSTARRFLAGVRPETLVGTNETMEYFALQLLLGNVESYETKRNELAKTLDEIKSHDELRAVIRFCCLRPMDESFASQLVAVMEKDEYFSHSNAVLVYYRAGDLLRAKALGVQTTFALYDLVLAMTCCRANEFEDAKKHLAVADRKMSVESESGNRKAGESYEWLFLHVLRREAAEMLGTGDKPEAAGVTTPKQE